MDILAMMLEIAGWFFITIGFIVGAFVLHWVLGIIAIGLVFIILFSIVVDTENDKR